MRFLIRCIVFIIGAVSCIMVYAATPVLQIGLAPNADLQMVFDFTNANDTEHWVRCGAATGSTFSQDFPDNPIRPFIGPDGNVWLWASNSRALPTSLSDGYGSYIKEANADISGPAPGVDQCRVGFEYTPVTPAIGNEPQSLASLNNLHWLLEFWVNGGTGRNFQAMAVIQNDFHGDGLEDGCGSSAGIGIGIGACRYTNLVAGSWSNLQSQFTVPTTQVASPNSSGTPYSYITSPLFVTPYQYVPSLNAAQGVNAQTNILYVQNPGDRIPFYYMLINEAAVTPYPNPSTVSSGLCLFRTNDVYDPGSWAGWNANTHSFSVKFNVNPYTTPLANPQTCSVVLPSAYRYALAYDPQYKTFIAVGVGNTANIQDSTVVYATTQDLTSWGDPPAEFPYTGHVLWRNSDTPQYVAYQFWSSHSYAEAYLGFIDPTSSSISQTYFGRPDNNFQYVGDHPYLYMVYFNPQGVPREGGDTWKDVKRLPLTITCTANCSS